MRRVRMTNVTDPTLRTAYRSNSECDRGNSAVVTVQLGALLGHKLGNRHLALGLVVNVPGPPKPLHLPVATLNSFGIVYHGPSMSRRHFLIHFPQFHDGHPLHTVSANRQFDNVRAWRGLTVRERT
jgi:hypothetical protein